MQEQITQTLWSLTELEAAALAMLHELEVARDAMREVVARDREEGG